MPPAKNIKKIEPMTAGKCKNSPTDALMTAQTMVKAKATKTPTHKWPVALDTRVIMIAATPALAPTEINEDGAQGNDHESDGAFHEALPKELSPNGFARNEGRNNGENQNAKGESHEGNDGRDVGFPPRDDIFPRKCLFKPLLPGLFLRRNHRLSLARR